MRGSNMTISAPASLNPREKALEDYRRRLKEHKELSAKLKQSKRIIERIKKNFYLKEKILIIFLT